MTLKNCKDNVDDLAICVIDTFILIISYNLTSTVSTSIC